MQPLTEAIQDLITLRVRLAKKSISPDEILRSVNAILPKLTTVNERNIVETHICNVYTMDTAKIRSFRAKVSLSTMSSKAKSLIYKACDDRLATAKLSDALCVSSDTSDWEDV